MASAALGNTVRFNFTGRLADGTEFETTDGKGPVEAKLGDGQLMPAVETALVGMSEGDKKVVEVDAGDAFGPHRPELVHSVSRQQIPDEIDLQVGKRLSATDSSGRTVDLVVTEVDDDSVTLDENHPLAGHDLTFELELVGVQ